jgi:hypothetical protein
MTEDIPPGEPILRVNEETVEGLRTPYKPFEGKEVKEQYVAFLDILGFGEAVITGFEATLTIYENMLNKLRIVKCFEMGVSIQVVSDSIVLISERLDPLLSVCKIAHAVTLLEHCLIRGGIGYGKHVDVTDGENRYVVSQAVVNAVHVEKTVRWPCVAIDQRIAINPKHWFPRSQPIRRSVVHYQGMNLVCPLNFWWGSTAIDRVEQMKEMFPRHSEKFDWFLLFAEQILTGAELVPDGYEGP